MYKNIVIVVLALALVAGGGLFLYQNNQTPSEDDIQVEEGEELEADIVEEDPESAEEESAKEQSTNTTAPTADYTNWKHLSDNSTKYLIWWGEKVAMVENCPGGYNYEYDDYYCPGERNLQFEWLDGSVKKVPSSIGEDFLLALRTYYPGGTATFNYGVTPDEKHLIYLQYSDSGSKLISYNIAEASYDSEMSFLPPAEQYDSCSGVQIFGWNNEQTRLGIISGNFGHADYPDNTKLFILQFKDGKIIQKDKYNLPVLTDCTPNNAPFYAIEWASGLNVMYYESPEDYDLAEKMENAYWSDQRYTSGYAKYYKVK